LQGLKTYLVAFARHTHLVKLTITNRVYSTLALPYVLIAIETRFLDGMGKKGHGLFKRWMK
jgi:hypothetical protein